MMQCVYECVWSSLQQIEHQPDMVADLARAQMNRENGISRPCLRLGFFSRELGSAVPSLVSLLILHTQDEFDAYIRDSTPPSRYDSH